VLGRLNLEFQSPNIMSQGLDCQHPTDAVDDRMLKSVVIRVVVEQFDGDVGFRNGPTQEGVAGLFLLVGKGEA
jgi:hypothetical protein